MNIELSCSKINDLPIIDDWTIPKGLTHFSQPKVKLGNVFVYTKIQNFKIFKIEYLLYKSKL